MVLRKWSESQTLASSRQALVVFEASLSFMRSSLKNKQAKDLQKVMKSS